MLGGRVAYRRFVQEGLRDGHREEYYDVIDQRFLGEEGFIEKLKAQAEGSGGASPKENRNCRLPHRRSTVDVEPAMLSGADRGWETSRCRALVAYVLIRGLGYKLKDVAKCLGRDAATVSSLVSRYSDRMTENEELKKQAVRIAKHCLE